MLRRNFLLSSLAAPALFGAKRIDISRISLLTDEIARSPAEAMAFAKQYGIQWVELRRVPGGGGTYAYLEEAKVREAAKALKDAGLGVSFLNTPMLKFTLPGTEPVRRREETADAKMKRIELDKQQFERRIDDLRKAIRSAQILG